MTRIPTAKHRVRGFSLVELVSVIIIVGVLAVIAVPRYVALGRDARLASLNSMAGAVYTAAVNAHNACAVSTSCDLNNYSFYGLVGGQYAQLNDGWPEAGDNIGGNQIDTWVNYAGFTATLPNNVVTRFTLDGAPDPSNCAVNYTQAFAPTGPTVTTLTSGC